ncbi:MAG: DUF2635 domain-containing protein [Burkholderiaceae bacterium]|jgi:hypothetical protein|nr:DUF2635 domain-containing protein [Burkholderiaceae bacterium]
MTTTIHLQPAPGVRVLDPATRQRLPSEGLQLAADSPDATYWLRRLADGDVQTVTAKPVRTSPDKPKTTSRSAT